MLICCDNGAVITNGNDFLEQVQKTLGITMDDFVNGINKKRSCNLSFSFYFFEL